MPKNEIAHELFSNKVKGNLNPKNLEKIKKKKELQEVIEMNLPTMIDFYFDDCSKKDMDNYKDQIFQTITSERYFYKPLRKMLSKEKKVKKFSKKFQGLHVIYIDSLDRLRFKFEKKMRELDNNGQSRNSDAQNEFMDELKSKKQDQINKVLDLVSILVEKPTKYFEEEGIKGEFAEAIARAMVPSKYLNERNIGFYFRRLNSTLIECQRAGMIPETTNEGEENYINNVGLNLMSKDSLHMIYSCFFAGVSRKVFIKALTTFLLEKRPYKYNDYNSIVKGLYNAINEFMLNVIEGKIVINTSGKKISKKEKEDFKVSKKELKEILKNYSNTRYNDLKQNKDSARRIVLSKVDSDDYPRITKIFNNVKEETIDDIDDFSDEDNNKNKNNRNNNNNKKNNKK